MHPYPIVTLAIKCVPVQAQHTLDGLIAQIMIPDKR